MNWNELWWCLACQRFPVCLGTTPSALVSGCVGSMSWPSNEWACWGILLHTPTAAPKKNPTKIDPLHFKSHESKGGLSQKMLVCSVCSSIICSLPREPQASDHVIVSLGRSDCEFVKLVTSTCAIYINLHSFYSTIFSNSSPPHATLYVLHESVSVLPGYIWTWLQ